MDYMTFSRYEGLMKDYGYWRTEGRAVPGMYPSNTIPQGRREWPKKRITGTRLPKGASEYEKARKQLRKAMLTQPHGNREQGKSKVLLFPVEPQLERIHSIVLRLPTDLQAVVFFAWIKRLENGRHLSHGEVAEVLSISSKHVKRRKKAIFQALQQSI